VNAKFGFAWWDRRLQTLGLFELAQLNTPFRKFGHVLPDRLLTGRPLGPAPVRASRVGERATESRDPLSPHRTGDADFPRPALLKTLASRRVASVINIQPYATHVNPYPISAEMAAAAQIRSYLLRSGSRYPALRRPLLWPAPFTASTLLLAPLHYGRFQPHPDQLQDRTVHHPHAHTC